MRRAILMCAGEYEPVPIPVEKETQSLRSAEAFDDCRDERPLVVAVDGGLPRLLAQGITPDIVLGDFDSLDPAFESILEKFGSENPDRLLRLPCEKDDTDTVYASRICLEHGCKELLFYGALGGRLDHTVANLQTLVWLKKRGADGYLIGKTTLACLVEAETLRLPPDYEGTFSLFALDERVTGVTLRGMKYPLAEAKLTHAFPIGVSNEVDRDSVRQTEDGCASVSVRSGLALVILEKAEADCMPDPALFERIPF